MSEGDQPERPPPRQFPESILDLDKVLDDMAEAECVAVKTLARGEACATANWDELAWLSVEEWRALRGAMMLVVGVTRLSGVADDDSTVLEGWGTGWLETPAWDDLYPRTKMWSLCLLCDCLDPSVGELYAAAEHCGRRLTPAQQLSLADHLDDISAACSAHQRALIDDIRETMLLA